ncbi:MAG: hypothetical protein LBB77_03910 [Treponema sp.]|nr:hypothetical protein [Treponema sp.]
MDNRTYESVTAWKLAEGSRCIIFAASDGQVSAATAEAIAREYDANIYPKIAGVFGDYASWNFDVDSNGKIILLLLDIKDGYNGSGGYVAGYFDKYHMGNDTASNRADMLFIDINPQVPGSQSFYVSIAHELQHLTNFAMHNGESQDLWLDEGLSSAAEYLYGGHQDSRVFYFNQDPKGTIARGNNFFVWDDWESKYGDSLANYATVYLFFQWLRIHHPGGTGVYRTISNSNEKDYRAVTGAVTGWTDITGTSEEVWDQLLSSWMIANCLNAPKGRYGYNGEIRTVVWSFKRSGTGSTPLFPGEGVYSEIKTGVGVSTGNESYIKYLGIGGTPENPNIVVQSPYTGKVLLTYNANPNRLESSENGFVQSYSPSSPASAVFSETARSALPSGGLPSSYPIGAHDLQARSPAGETGSLR